MIATKNRKIKPHLICAHIGAPPPPPVAPPPPVVAPDAVEKGI